MARSTKGRRLGTWALGAAAVCVLLLLAVYRRELWSLYLGIYWHRIDVVLVDNCDPNYRPPGPHHDSARFLNADGEEIFRFGGLNNCESVGANHVIALDPERFRIFVSEVARDRIVALGPRGDTLFTIEGQDLGAIAVDPASGSLWVLSGDLGPSGETLVFTEDGHRLPSHAAQGFDLCYSPFDRSFWVVGDRVYKLDAEGGVLFEKHRVGWAKVSVCPDPRDGSVWVVERNRAAVPGNSSDRLLRLDSSGEIVQQLKVNRPVGVACEPDTGNVWVAARSALLRFSPDGESLGALSQPALAVSIGARTKHIWAAKPSGAVQLSRDGTVIAEYKLPTASSQAWVIAR